MGIYPPVWRWEYFPLAASLAIGIIPLRAGCGLVMQYLFEGSLDSLQARSDLIFSGGLSWSSFLIVLIGVGVLAPIAEELYFRGLLYGWFRQRYGVIVGIVVSSLLFGMAHFDSIAVVFSSMIIGAVMAYMYQRTGSLWVAIAMHVITNTTAVFLTYGLMLISKIYSLPLPGI
jgi:membrane protease YdiL (CAAX protease family)